MDEFDRWNKLKKNISNKSIPFSFVPKEAEVWMCVLGKNIGYEQSGRGSRFLRPVLLIKRFNKHMFWAVPLSTKQKGIYFYYNFTAPDNSGASAILAQLKLISVNRLTRKLYKMPKKDLEIIRSRLITFIKKTPLDCGDF